MSNKDPKRIWVDHTILDEFDTELCPESDVEYIRADIGEEIREALEEMTELNRAYWKSIGFEPSVGGTFEEVLNKANTALKLLEEQ